MKNIKILASLLFLLIFSSCIINVDATPDSDFFTGFDPLEWSDGYVFLPTDNPQQIQVWNTESKKLVYTYNLVKEFTVLGKNCVRALSVDDMVVINKDIWLLGAGMNYNLIKINVPTGKVEYVLKGVELVSIAADNKWENGEGCVFGMTLPYPNSGMTVYKFSLDGKLLEKKNVLDEDLCMTSLSTIQYINNQYYLLGSKYEDFYLERQSQKGIKLINLSKEDNYITDINYEKLFPKNFLKDNLKVVPDSFIINFNAFYNMAEDYLSVAIAGYRDSDSHYVCARFLFKIHSFEDLDLEYTGMNYQKDDVRVMLSASENDENIFLSGRVLHDESFHGLETGVYSKATGKELYRMRMASSNQLHYEIKDDKTWFPQDVNEQDENLEWYSIPKGCYMLDHKTGRTYWYDVDGNETEMEQMAVLE